jgi:hypothetical protein
MMNSMSLANDYGQPIKCSHILKLSFVEIIVSVIQCIFYSSKVQSQFHTKETLEDMSMSFKQKVPCPGHLSYCQ